jgi:hypothetical protein
MRNTAAAVAVFIVALGLGPVIAKGGPPAVKPGVGGAIKTVPSSGPKSGPIKTTGVKTTPAKPTGAGKPLTTGNGKATGSGKSTTTSSPGSASSAKRHGNASTSTSTTPSTTTETVTGPNVPKNPKLQARLQAMLPPGMTLADAAAGFKNQGQFVAALHVSKNLGISFTELKTRMVDDGFSLGQAIQDLKPTANATTEARRGEQQAEADLR